jgi:hypothetical protein
MNCAKINSWDAEADQPDFFLLLLTLTALKTCYNEEVMWLRVLCMARTVTVIDSS